MNGLLGYSLAVTYLDGHEEEVHPTGGDGITWERHFGLPFVAIYGEDGVRLEHLWYCAWLGARRLHPDIEDFDAWTETVDVVARAEEPKKVRKKAAPVPLDRAI